MNTTEFFGEKRNTFFESKKEIHSYFSAIMSSKNDKADEIKNLAINGLFDDILHKFGEKSMSKGKEYVSKN